jgi:ATP synthase I chain
MRFLALLTRQSPKNTGKISGFAMTQNENSGRDTPVLTLSTRDDRLHSRVCRTMIVTTVAAVLWSLIFTSLQVTTGLLIGGVLALLNHRWLQTSISAAFGVLVDGQTPRITLTKYFIRYFIVGGAAFAAYTLGIASLPAIIAGLCTFVVALFVEAIREMYLAIIHREEIS